MVRGTHPTSISNISLWLNLMTSLKNQLAKVLENQIDGLKIQQDDGSSLLCVFFKGKEFAHFHEDNELDLRLTRSVIKREGLAHPSNSKQHPNRSPNSQWIELPFNSSADFKRIVRLVQLGVDQLRS